MKALMNRVVTLIIVITIMTSIITPSITVNAVDTNNTSNSVIDTYPTEYTENTQVSTQESTQVSTQVSTQESTQESTQVTESTAPTVPTTATEPVESNPTTEVILSRQSKTIYVANTYKIKVKVVNRKGKTSFTSSKPKVAKVMKNGKVVAKKKGRAIITVKNNGVIAKLTVVVKKPYLNKKKVTLPVGSKFKLNVIGKKGKPKFESVNKNIVTVTKKGKLIAKNVGKAKVRVKTNGKFKLVCTVKVRKKNVPELLKYNIKQLRKSLTINVGEKEYPLLKTTKDAVYSERYDTWKGRRGGFYDITHNLSDIGTHWVDANDYKSGKILASNGSGQYLVQGQISDAQYNVWQKKIGEIKTSFSKDGIAEIKVYKNKFEPDNYYLVPKKEGKTVLTIEFFDGSKIQQTINVTKIKSTVINGKKAIACYSGQDLYEIIRDNYYKHILIGVRPEYEYYLCYFDTEKLGDDWFDEFALKDTTCANVQEMYYMEDSFRLSDEVTTGQDVEIYGTSSEECEIGKYVLSKSEFEESKFAYKYAYDVLYNQIKIDQYKNDFEKIVAITCWLMRETIYYDEYTAKNEEISARFDYWEERFGKNGNHQSGTFFYLKSGQCGAYSRAGVYICSLLGIECVELSDYEQPSVHGWNYVKLDGKWYQWDPCWFILPCTKIDYSQHAIESHQISGYNEDIVHTKDIATEEHPLMTDELKTLFREACNQLDFDYSRSFFTCWD